MSISGLYYPIVHSPRDLPYCSFLVVYSLAIKLLFAMCKYLSTLARYY